ncbi:integrase core domain-containing protein [Streptomyces sp. BH055]|uniref:integrase core domain-containing protein n=1 Tax=Streptomyces sp. BH055 TaxID=3401173 RepID=UPI003BB73D46
MGHSIAPSAVWQILHAAGVDPAPPGNGPSRREFLTARADGLLAADFFHIDTITGKRLCALAFLEHGTRRLHISGIPTHPTAQWAIQQARNLTAGLGTRVESLRFLPRDRDSKYTDAFGAIFEAEGIDMQLSAPWAPRMNAHCERVIGTIRREALDHAVVMNGAHSRHALAEFQKHYNSHRPQVARPTANCGSTSAASRARGHAVQAPAHTHPRRSHQPVSVHGLSCADDLSSLPQARPAKHRSQLFHKYFRAQRPLAAPD